MVRGIIIPCLVGAMLAAAPAWADLVTNGDFSAGSPSQGNQVGNGWSNSDGSIVIDTVFVSPDNTSGFDASFTGSGILSQTLSTIAGEDYILSFSVLSETGSPLDLFTVGLGGFSLTLTGDQASLYQQESLIVPGADLSGGDTLSFQAGNFFGGASSEPWNLDDVSVTPQAVPEPGSIALLLTTLGLGGLTLLRTRRTVPRQR
jgi:hypothetical protein